MSTQKQVKKTLLQDNKIKVAGIDLYKMTASSFTLCEILEMSITAGKEGKHPQIEILMFLYLHFLGARKARELILDDSEGVDKHGRSRVFMNACMDWADNINMRDYTELAQGIATMLNDGFGGAIETPVEEQKGNARKVA